MNLSRSVIKNNAFVFSLQECSIQYQSYVVATIEINDNLFDHVIHILLKLYN